MAICEWLYSGLCAKCKRSHVASVTTDSDVVPNPVIGIDCPCAPNTAVALMRRAES